VPCSSCVTDEFRYFDVDIYLSFSALDVCYVAVPFLQVTCCSELCIDYSEWLTFYGIYNYIFVLRL